MSELLVSIELPEGPHSRWRVPATVYGLDSAFAQEIVVTTGGPRVNVTVAPGQYLVQAYLPSGELLRRTATVEEGNDIEVPLVMAASPHEWMVTPARMAPKNRLRTAFVDRPGDPEAGVDSVPNPFAALRDWLESPKAASGVPPVESDRMVGRFDLRPGSQFGSGPMRGGILFVVRRGAVSRAVALPLWLRGDGSEADFEVVVNRATGTISTTVQDEQFAPVLGYLADGQSELAARALDEQAMELLAGKVMNPFAAAAGGYVLLQRALQGEEPNRQWRNWIRNLAEWFPAFPDGWLIRGTLLLNRLSAQGDEKGDAGVLAMECFRRAADLGVPLFGAGVRLLLDGMLAANGDVPPDSRLTWVRRLSLHVERDEPFTTLRVEGTL